MTMAVMFSRQNLVHSRAVRIIEKILFLYKRLKGIWFIFSVIFSVVSLEKKLGKMIKLVAVQGLGRVRKEGISPFSLNSGWLV